MYTIVVGAGMVGQNLAEALYREGYDVTLIDQKAASLERAAESLDIQTFLGHGADAELLAQAGVRAADFFMAVTDVDEVNLLACLAAKEMGALITVARVTNRVYLGGRRALYRNLMGVDIVVSPENLTAIEIVKHARAAGVVAIENLTAGRLALREFKASDRKSAVGGPIRDLELPPSTLLTIIMRAGVAIVPSGKDLVQPDDEVFVLGHAKDVGEATRKLGREVGVVTRAIVVGGGQIGLLTARSLADLDVDVRLIELNPARSRELSEEIRKGEVLCGDGTDVMLLREAGIEGIDLFVAACGQDELNLVLGMLAGELGAQKRVVIVRRRDYLTITQRLSVDAAISPRQQTAEAILRYIRRPKFTHLATLGENQTEILDTIVTSSSAIRDRRLAELELPHGLLIGAIVRGDEVVIPGGDTVLEAGDNVIVFADREATSQLDTLF